MTCTTQYFPGRTPRSVRGMLRELVTTSLAIDVSSTSAFPLYTPLVTTPSFTKGGSMGASHLRLEMTVSMAMLLAGLSLPSLQFAIDGVAVGVATIGTAFVTAMPPTMNSGALSRDARAASGPHTASVLWSIVSGGVGNAMECFAATRPFTDHCTLTVYEVRP